jgi:hypothetical protein
MKTQKNRTAATNTGFASGGVTCKHGALCFYSSSVLKIPPIANTQTVMCNANRSEQPTVLTESFVLRTFRQSRLAIASAKAKEKQSNRTNPTQFCFTFAFAPTLKDTSS